MKCKCSGEIRTIHLASGKCMMCGGVVDIPAMNNIKKKRSSLITKMARKAVKKGKKKNSSSSECHEENVSSCHRSSGSHC